MGAQIIDWADHVSLKALVAQQAATIATMQNAILSQSSTNYYGTLSIDASSSITSYTDEGYFGQAVRRNGIPEKRHNYSDGPLIRERTGTQNPFDGIYVGSYYASPSCGTDFDGDGKQECVVGNRDGKLKYLVNTGTSTSPKFTERSGTQNPFDGIDVGYMS